MKPFYRTGLAGALLDLGRVEESITESNRS